MSGSHKIRWSGPAVDDLEKLYEQIAQYDRTAAACYAQQVTDSVKQLGEHPRMGVALRDSPLEGEFRSVVVRNHRLVYRVDEEIVRIYRVRDCRQDPAGFWTRMEGDQS